MKKILGLVVIILGFGIGGFIVKAGSTLVGAIVSIVGLVAGAKMMKSA